jgi:predicted permease
MIANSCFELPFIQALYGAEGVVRIAAFDAMNTPLTFSWACLMAAQGEPRPAARWRGPDEEAGSESGAVGDRPGCGSSSTWRQCGRSTCCVPVPTPVHDSPAVFGSATAIIVRQAVGIQLRPSAGQFGKAALMTGCGWPPGCWSRSD